MRFTSRPTHGGVTASLLPSHNQQSAENEEPELSAFRGLLVALSFSALFWGACLTAVWLLFARS
jgi:hypothetical protein